MKYVYILTNKIGETNNKHHQKKKNMYTVQLFETRRCTGEMNRHNKKKKKKKKMITESFFYIYV
jgi:hypothetical protein